MFWNLTSSCLSWENFFTNRKLHAFYAQKICAYPVVLYRILQGQAIPSIVFSDALIQIQHNLTPTEQKPQEQSFSSLVIFLLLDFITLRLYYNTMMNYAPCKIRVRWNSINQRICDMLKAVFLMTENTGSSDLMIIKTLTVISGSLFLNKNW